MNFKKTPVRVPFIWLWCEDSKTMQVGVKGASEEVCVVMELFYTTSILSRPKL